MQVGEVKIAEDVDFERLKQLCRTNDGWKQDFSKHGTVVSSKRNDLSDFKVIRIRSTFKDVSASLVYDVLHDPHYRKEWDTSMLEGYEICFLNPNNDIGYYALKMPKPLKNRDFVIQRSWLDTGREYLIVNHSVNHADVQPRKGFIRGISYITGYWIIPTNSKSNVHEPGCEVTYVTQSDPKGKLPSWLVNKVTKSFAPKVMNKVHKACRGYETWKAGNRPNFKPWIFPEQIDLPRLRLEDIRSMQECQSSESIDESSLNEEDVVDDDDSLSDGV